jgi:hypothetical protein
MGKTEKSSRKSKSAWASLKGQSPTPYRRRSNLETATDLDIFARTLHRLDENCKKTIDSLTQAAMELEKDGLEKDIVIAMQIHILTVTDLNAEKYSFLQGKFQLPKCGFL